MLWDILSASGPGEIQHGAFGTGKPFPLCTAKALYKAQEHRLSSYLKTPTPRHSENNRSSAYAFSVVSVCTQVPYIKTSVS